MSGAEPPRPEAQGASSNGHELEVVSVLVQLWTHENEILNMKLGGLLALESFLFVAYKSARESWIASAGILLILLGLASIKRTSDYRERWWAQARDRASGTGLDLAKLRRTWLARIAHAEFWVPVLVLVLWVVVLIRGPAVIGSSP
jgi:hypothetical protein